MFATSLAVLLHVILIRKFRDGKEREPSFIGQGRTQEGADGAKALPEIKKKIIYSFKYGAFYVLQFVQRS